MAEMASLLIQVKFYYINKYYCMIPLNKAATSFLDSFFLKDLEKIRLDKENAIKDYSINVLLIEE